MGCPPDQGCPFPDACEDGESRRCINFCVPLATEADIEAGARCALDPCDELAYGGDVLACPTLTRCANTGESDRFGRCVPTEAGGRACGNDGDASTSCPRASFCMSTSCSARYAAYQQLTGFTEDAPAGVCLPYAPEGARCDSDARDVVGTSAFEGGCSVCEPGTFCQPSGDGTDPRCVRLCEDGDGTQNAGLCACTGSQCSQGPVTDPDTGERRPGFFCTPCSENGRRCENDNECCRDGASCQREFDSVTLEPSRCCFDEGATCTRDGDCCLGALCESGTCQPCGLRGDDAAQQPCCPGHETYMFGDRLICQTCGFLGDLSHLCNPDEFLNLQNTQGDWETTLIPEGEARWTDVVGHVSGPLEVTRERLAEVRYQLSDNRRAFLFQDRLDLDDSVPIGRSFLELQQSDGRLLSQGIPDPGAWRSVRVYDVGSCSFHQSWDELAALLSAEVNKFLIVNGPATFGGQWANVNGHALTRVAPRLRADPLLPTRFRRGPERGLDSIDVEYGIDIQELCVDGVRVKVTLTPTVEPASQGGTNNSLGQANDAVMAQVRCDPPADEESTEWRCFLPEPIEGGYRLIERSVERRLLDPSRVESCLDDCPDECDLGDRRCSQTCCEDRNPNPLLQINDIVAASVGCFVAYDEYRCSLPFSAPYASPRTTQLIVGARPFARPLDYLPGGTDLIARISNVDFEVDSGCEVLGELILDAFEQDVEIALWGSIANFNQVIDGVFGTSVIGDFNSMPRACATNADCRPLYGNYRTQCVAGVCDQTGLEARRVAVRPDGLDIVLSEGPGDPQEPLVRRHTIAGPVCGINRFGVGNRANPTAGRIQTALAPDSLTAEFCNPADPNECDDICLQTGTTCASATVVLPLLYPTLNRRARCFTGQCCRPEDACGGVCRDRATDAAHCGECDNACTAGNVCAASECCDASSVCDGACADLQNDAANCGGCGIACTDDNRCVDGACCDGLVCGGVCTDPGTTTDCRGCGVLCEDAEACCADGCSDLRSRRHCGACGRSCDRGETCAFGACIEL